MADISSIILHCCTAVIEAYGQMMGIPAACLNRMTYAISISKGIEVPQEVVA